MLAAPLGQGKALGRLLRAARLLRMHHGVIVAGPVGAGKTTVTRWLAAALLCPSDLDADGPCGICRTCRLVASGQHAALHIVTVPEGKRQIPIARVREVQEDLAHYALEGRARVVIIDPAEQLNDEGQNALLKTLEEPGADTFLLLATSRPEALLPTVRSRCERLQLIRLSDEQLLRQLRTKKPDAAERYEQAVQLAGGSLGAALSACTERAVQLHDLVQQLMAGNQELRPVQAARAVLALADGRADTIACVRTFLALVRRGCSGRLRALANEGSRSYVPPPSEPWATISELTLSAEQDLEVQIPPEQALGGMLVEWGRLLRSSR